MKLINALALSLFLASAEAFGPSTPVSGNAFGVSSSVGKKNDMTMRVGMGDMKRKQKINDILKTSGNANSKEAVEQHLLSAETGAMVEKSNWKLRKSMLRKIRAQANRFGVEVDPAFGLP